MDSLPQYIVNHTMCLEGGVGLQAHINTNHTTQSLSRKAKLMLRISCVLLPGQECQTVEGGQ